MFLVWPQLNCSPQGHRRPRFPFFFTCQTATYFADTPKPPAVAELQIFALSGKRRRRGSFYPPAPTNQTWGSFPPFQGGKIALATPDEFGRHLGGELIGTRAPLLVAPVKFKWSFPLLFQGRPQPCSVPSSARCQGSAATHPVPPSAPRSALLSAECRTATDRPDHVDGCVQPPKHLGRQRRCPLGKIHHNRFPLPPRSHSAEGVALRYSPGGDLPPSGRYVRGSGFSHRP